MKSIFTITAILVLVSVNGVFGKSWKSYVDDDLIGSGFLQKAAIIDHDGQILAVSDDFSLTTEETSGIVSIFLNPDLIRKGVTVGGVKYFGIRANEHSIYGKKGDAGVVLVKSDQTIVIGVYDQQSQSQMASRVVNAVADHLNNVEGE